jgi:hypothetical protein
LTTKKYYNLDSEVSPFSVAAVRRLVAITSRLDRSAQLSLTINLYLFLTGVVRLDALNFLQMIFGPIH